MFFQIRSGEHEAVQNEEERNSCGRLDAKFRKKSFGMDAYAMADE